MGMWKNVLPFQSDTVIYGILVEKVHLCRTVTKHAVSALQYDSTGAHVSRRRTVNMQSSVSNPPSKKNK